MTENQEKAFKGFTWLIVLTALGLSIWAIVKSNDSDSK